MKRLGLLSIFVFLCAVAYAATPQVIGYQGYLAQSGTAVTGAKSMTFKLYDAASGGTMLCTSGAQSISVDTGLFSYDIGSGDCDLSTINWENPVYLEISVEGTAFTPREQVTGAAYTLQSTAGDVSFTPAGDLAATDVQAAIEELDTEKMSITGGTFSGDIIAQGDVTAENVTASGTVSAGSFVGDGSGITGIVSTATDADTLDSHDSTEFLLTTGGTISGSLTVSSDLYISGDITAATSTVTAGSFVGDGSGLTGITATDADTLDGLDSSEFISDTGGSMSGTLDIDGDLNIVNGGISVATGSVTAGYFYGDGSGLTGIAASDADTLDGLDSTDFMFATQDLWVDTSGDTMTGPLDIMFTSTMDALTVSNAGIGNAILASGAVEIQGELNVMGNVSAGYFMGDGSMLTGITASDADTLDGLDSSAFMSATQDLWVDSAGDIMTGTLTMSSGDVVVSNGNVDASSGSVTAAYFYGDGSGLTGISGGGGDADTLDGMDSTEFISTSGGSMSGTLDLDGYLNVTNGGIDVATGQVVAGSFIGDGSMLTGIDAGISPSGGTMSGPLGIYYDTSTAALHVENNNMGGQAIYASGVVEIAGEMDVLGTVSAGYFMGDGSGLTGISGGSGVNPGGDTMTGALQILYDTSTASLYVENNDPLGTSIMASGTLFVEGDIESSNTITAVEFIGDGSGLTGILASDADTLDGLDSTAFMSATQDLWVDTAGDTMNGPLSVSYDSSGDTLYVSNAGIGNAFSASGAVEIQGQLNVMGDVAAGYFIGDGSMLTGISAGGGGVNPAGGTMSGPLNIFADTSTDSLYIENNDPVGYAMYASGTVYANEFVGDGSGLTGISAGGGVAKTGDTMSGPLAIYYDSATDTLAVENNTPGGVAIYASGAVEVDGGVTVNGGVIATSFSGDGSGLTGITASGSLPLTGGVLTGELQVDTSAGATTAYFVNSGGGNTLVAENSGTGEGAIVYTSNPSNPKDTFSAANMGTGTAGYFEIMNGSSPGRVIEAITDGTGDVIYGRHDGAAGNLLYLETSGGHKLHVDQAGNVFASGTFFGDGSGLTGISGSGDGHSLDADDGSPMDALYVDSNGNVGIGTTSPGSILHVKGSSAQIDIEEFGTSNRTASIGFLDAYNLVLNNSVGNIEAIMTNQFRVSDTLGVNNLLLVDVYNGNVGIGGSMSDSTNGANMVILNSGYVGIGNATPTSELHVNGITKLEDDTQWPLLVQRSTAGANDQLTSIELQGKDSAGNYETQAVISGAFSDYLQGDEESYMTFSVRNSNSIVERMRILTTGEIGIGTTTPSYTLDIVGNLRTSSDIHASASAYIDGTVTAASFVGDGSGLTGISGGSGVSTTGDIMSGSLQIDATTATSTLSATNFGTGNAAYFSISNGSNSDAALYAETDGIGDAIYASGPVGVQGEVTVTGAVTAGAFYGDGSNLTGLNAGGGVAKTGDTMTGSLSVYFDTSTDTLYVENNDPVGNAINASGTVYVGGDIIATSFIGDGSGLTGISSSGVQTTGDTMSGGLEILYDTSTQSLYIENNDIGYAMYASGTVYATEFVGDGSGLTGISGSGVQTTGDTMTGPLTISASTSSTALSVSNDTAADVASFTAIGSSNPGTAVFGYTYGSGNAGFFQINNTTSTQDALVGKTNGASGSGVRGIAETGATNGGYFEITSATSTYAAVHATTVGDGPLFYGENPSGTGHLIALQNSAGGGLYVDNAGNVFASGTFNGDGSGLTGIGGSGVSTTGDIMSGSLQIDATTATSALNVTNFGTGNAAFFAISNGSNADAALYAETDGIGDAIYASGSIEASGNITAAQFVGDGSMLTGIPVGLDPMGDTMNGALEILHDSSTQSLYIENNSGVGYAMYASGTVYATEFVGDGSMLTGISAGGGVAKTGDTMTGPLSILFNTSTDTLYLENSGIGYAMYASGTVYAEKYEGDGSMLTGIPVGLDPMGDTMTGGLEILYDTSTQSLYIENNDIGYAMYASGTVYAEKYEGDGSMLTGIPVGLDPMGDTMNGALEILHDSSTQSLYIENNSGVGYAMYASGTVYAEKYEGDGSMLTGISDLAAVRAGGDTMSGPLSINATTSTDSLYIENADNTGNFVRFWSMSNPQFVVDAFGNVHASGTIYADGSGLVNVPAVDLAGDEMGGALGIWSNTATPTLSVVQSTPSYAAIQARNPYAGPTAPIMDLTTQGTGNIMILNNNTGPVLVADSFGDLYASGTITSANGISTTGPVAFGSATITGAVSIAASTSTALLEVAQADMTAEAAWLEVTNPSNSTAGVYIGTAGTGHAALFESLNMSGTATVYIRTDSSAGNLIETNKGAYLSNSGVWTDASSRALKKDIKSLTDSDRAEMLQTVKGIDIVRFRYKNSGDQKLHIGVIAEEAPDEMTDSEKRGVQTVDAVGMIIAAMQEQQQQIEEQQKTLEEQKALIDQLMQKLEEK